MLHKPDLSGRLVKWAIELGKFDVIYTPPAALKGQAIADFVAEFTYERSVHHLDHHQSVDTLVQVNAHTLEPSVPPWELYVDGSFNVKGSGAILRFLDSVL